MFDFIFMAAMMASVHDRVGVVLDIDVLFQQSGILSHVFALGALVQLTVRVVPAVHVDVYI